jgi:hypothetical protein
MSCILIFSLSKSLRETCNNQRPRCDIAWLHATNYLYQGFPISHFVFNSENNVNITYTMSGLSITFYWTGELLFWTGESNWVPKGRFFFGGSWNSRVKIQHSGEFWKYLLGCLKEIFRDMLSYFILIIIAGTKYKCDSLMEDKKNISVGHHTVCYNRQRPIQKSNL